MSTVHLFNGLSRASWYQKGQTNLDFTEARDSEWQWHQLGHMQICTLLQTDDHASTLSLKFFTGRMPFLMSTVVIKNALSALTLLAGLQVEHLAQKTER